jgi:chaperonin GroES
MASPVEKEYAVLPVGNRYLIEIPEDEEKIGSIYLPPSADRTRKACRGKIVAAPTLLTPADVFDDDPDAPPPIFRVGDMVIFGRWSGTEVTIKRKKFLLMPAGEIIAKIIDANAPISVEDED